MSKCTKVKNPCKICLGAVSQKTGLQCQGACQSWVHYSCLNYTPGKIKDIRAGIIKVSCPCPDCKTSMPKEYRTDQPYSCNNSMCPANRPPKCENNTCPINRNGKSGQTAPCPLNKCGTECKQFSSPRLPDSKANSTPLPKPCMPVCNVGAPSSSDACLTKSPQCPSGCSSTNDISGDFGVYQTTTGVGGGSGSMPSFQIVEQMCNTVGQLTNKINELMLQMKHAAKYKDGSGYHGGNSPKECCTSQGPKELCPKPCFCPGNPARRM